MRLRITIAGVWLAIAATTGCGNPPGEPLRIGLLVWSISDTGIRATGPSW